MSAKRPDRFRGFRMVTFSRPTGIPLGWDEELLAKGVPDGLSYQVADELTLIEDPESGPLVSFGTQGIYCRICLDPRTTQVVYVVCGARELGNPEEKVIQSARLVNSDLERFTASVRAVTERFPYDTESATNSSTMEDILDDWAKDDRIFAEWDQAAREMTETLRAIDPVAVEDPDSYWMTFIGDVQIGDYSITAILHNLGE